MTTPFQWDFNSDQPYQLKDRAFKKKKRSQQWPSLLKTFMISLFVLPLSLIAMPFVRPKKFNGSHFFAMGVNLDKNPQHTPALIKELGVRTLIIRFPLWEMARISEYLKFVQSFDSCTVTLNILQDREHIEDRELLEHDLKRIFESFQNDVESFQIGSTINRAKWGFFSVDEYLDFYETAYNLKKNHFPKLRLIGSNVIDFEFYFTAHTLFNLRKLRYDALGSLLYVDRRGAPENTQMGFNLSDKISLLAAMMRLSPKSDKHLYISETNWPITGTAPYAPTSEKECVSEQEYAAYMLRYYLLAFASQQVERVYWHQLIAPGYGLIDNRDGQLKKYSAFEAYAFMLKMLQDSQFLRLDIKRDYYILQAMRHEELIQVHWALTPTTLNNEKAFDAFSLQGHLIEDDKLCISPDPIYLHIKEPLL